LEISLLIDLQRRIPLLHLDMNRIRPASAA
jgi:hypothetical protein